MFLEFKKESITSREERFEKALRRADKGVKKLLQNKNKTFQSFILPFWMDNERLGWAFHPLSHLNSVKNGKKIQKVYTSALDKLTEHYTKIMQNEDIYKAFMMIKESQEFSSLAVDQRKGIEDTLLDFSLSGVGSSKKIKKRLAQIDLELGQLSNQYSQNVLDDTNSFSILVEESDVRELSVTDKQAAKVIEGGKTWYKFTLKYPSYVAYMTYGHNRDIREKLYKAYVTRGAKNKPLIDKILSLRHEKAQLLGFETFADLSVATKDAKSSHEVIAFLDELNKVAFPFAQQELEELKRYGTKIGIDDLQSFDTTYVAEKLRHELYDLDEDAYRPYFESSRVVDGMITFVCETFGVQASLTPCKTWNKKVLTYDFSRNGKPFSRLYLDLEARDDKKGGAWMDNWTSHCVDENGTEILPIVFVVCNFPPSRDDSPSLLKHSDVETLFHEMGHAIHHLFSTVSTVVTSGVNGVCWDVVEFPSQLLENFVFDETVLKTFAIHHLTNEVIPDEMIKRLKKAKNFQAALMMMRQLEFSSFDFHLHKGLYQNEEVEALAQTIREKNSLLMPPNYNKFHHSFTHIFSGGYAAGYYSYKWAEVLSAHLYLLMQDESQKKALAQRYLELVLSLGGSRPMNEMFKDVTGEDKDPKKLLELYGIKQ